MKHQTTRLKKIKLKELQHPEKYNVVFHKNCVHYLTSKNILSRLSGPSVIYNDGTECWYFKGKLHRVNGPAITSVFSDLKMFYLNGIEYPEKKYWSILRFNAYS